ncbi:DUF2075 domain-containing protein [Limobrevibacterium gyesilva]|uniref:DUF2075 domain-containing protein n=1 Tax=Limobrevibacterium gyesilva TaxID=2991712 RepID=A0AA41YIW2_9PROT|nr:DUF2075 domain-containing protein [Limobrevibacterium gyesilva]MCW3474441.1 DUF2075 domain-containing protein [Limobrevibacterium gyesilva]
MRVDAFLAADMQALVHRLAYDDARRFRRNESQQLRAWQVSIACLRAALADWPQAADWHLLLEYPMRRLGRRIDAVLVTGRAVLVLEFKVGRDRFDAADRQQVEDYALDLQDFHALSRNHPIVPILVATEAEPGPVTWPLLIAGVAPVLDASRASLPGLLRDLWQRMPRPSRDLPAAGWADAPYRPVPGIVDAACTLYSQHGVADIATALADARNLSATTDAILAAIGQARGGGHHAILFVTGIPGAGKTLCGLNTVFGAGRETGATFLTGNPTLVHVLREALARDAAASDRTQLRAARQRTKAAIQALPAFRDEYVRTGQHPPERVIVIDEAQRAWSAAHAIRKGRDREVALSDSEPGHLLDIMARHQDWAVIVCLVGNGQEIHDGEGGLAEWGAALAARPNWRVLAAPATLAATDVRQRLPALPGLRADAALHLDVPVRSIRNAAAAPWVDAVLANDAAGAWRIAESQGPLSFLLTRDLHSMRRFLRAAARGLRRCGLVGSSGARRLRADGMGAEVPHMDAGAVAHWFLDRWPDVRACDALEVVATEFSCQGLELDHVGLCWGGDLVRAGGRQSWLVRDFVGTKWQLPKGAEAIANRINTYRVLLTRARYQTVIWIPRGDADDATRTPRDFDAIADFLRACGVQELQSSAAASPAAAEPLLLV